MNALLKEARSHFDCLDEKFDLRTAFPDGSVRVVHLLRQADRSGTTFRYTGENHPTSEARIDFPNLASMLEEGFSVLCAFEDYVEAITDLVEDWLDEVRGI